MQIKWNLLSTEPFHHSWYTTQCWLHSQAELSLRSSNPAHKSRYKTVQLPEFLCWNTGDFFSLSLSPSKHGILLTDGFTVAMRSNIMRRLVEHCTPSTNFGYLWLYMHFDHSRSSTFAQVKSPYIGPHGFLLVNCDLSFILPHFWDSAAKSRTTSIWYPEFHHRQWLK